MIGGAWFNRVLGSNPSTTEVEEIAARSIAKQLNISVEPVNIRTNIIKVDTHLYNCQICLNVKCYIVN